MIKRYKKPFAIIFLFIFMFTLVSTPITNVQAEELVASKGLLTSELEPTTEFTCIDSKKELDKISADKSEDNVNQFQDNLKSGDVSFLTNVIMEFSTVILDSIVIQMTNLGCNTGISPVEWFKDTMSPITLTDKPIIAEYLKVFTNLGLILLGLMTLFQLTTHYFSGALGNDKNVIRLIIDTTVAAFLLKFFYLLYQDILNLSNVLVHYIMGMKLPISLDGSETLGYVSVENIPVATMMIAGQTLTNQLNDFGGIVTVIIFLVAVILMLKPIFQILFFLIKRVAMITIYPFMAPFVIPFLAGPNKDVFSRFLGNVLGTIFSIIPFLLGMIAGGMVLFTIPTIFDNWIIRIFGMVMVLEAILQMPRIIGEFMQTSSMHKGFSIPLQAAGRGFRSGVSSLYNRQAQEIRVDKNNGLLVKQGVAGSSLKERVNQRIYRDAASSTGATTKYLPKPKKNLRMHGK